MIFPRPAILLSALVLPVALAAAGTTLGGNMNAVNRGKSTLLSKTLPPPAHLSSAPVSSELVSVAENIRGGNAVAQLTAPRKALIGIGIFQGIYIIMAAFFREAFLDMNFVDPDHGAAGLFHLDLAVLFSVMNAFLCLKGGLLGSADTVKTVLQAETLLWAGLFVPLLIHWENSTPQQMVSSSLWAIVAALSVYFSTWRA
ncbi:unnamed protein product [Discosporangium mesarthrocarpum]